jgi:hypothetical protein
MCKAQSAVSPAALDANEGKRHEGGSVNRSQIDTRSKT